MKSLVILIPLALMTGCASMHRHAVCPAPAQLDITPAASSMPMLEESKLRYDAPLTVQVELVAPPALHAELLPMVSQAVQSMAQITDRPQYDISILAAQRGNTLALVLTVTAPERFDNLHALLQNQHMGDYETWLAQQKLGRFVLQDVKVVSNSPTEVNDAIVELVSKLKNLAR